MLMLIHALYYCTKYIWTRLVGKQQRLLGTSEEYNSLTDEELLAEDDTLSEENHKYDSCSSENISVSQYESDNLEGCLDIDGDISKPIDEFKEAFTYYESNNIRFHPPVYIQRYATVLNLLRDEKWKTEIRKVIEFGCAELKFVRYLKNLDYLRELLEVDVDSKVLEENKFRAQPDMSDYLSFRKNPLVISVLCGNVAHPDERLKDADAVICIELIEHLFPGDLEDLPYNIFGYIKPKIAIFTTPNKDFNIHFPNFTGFRHWDHKFEWTRQEFQNWALNICKRYQDYSVNFKGIGPGPTGKEEYGCCSQAAVFIRDELNISESNTFIPSATAAEYTLVDSVEFPYTKDDRTEDQIICDDVSNFISSATHIGTYWTGERTEIPLSAVQMRVYKICDSLEKLRQILRDSMYFIETNEEGDEVVVISRDNETSSSSDDNFELDKDWEKYMDEFSNQSDEIISEKNMDNSENVDKDDSVWDDDCCETSDSESVHSKRLEAEHRFESSSSDKICSASMLKNSDTLEIKTGLVIMDEQSLNSMYNIEACVDSLASKVSQVEMSSSSHLGHSSKISDEEIHQKETNLGAEGTKQGNDLPVMESSYENKVAETCTNLLVKVSESSKKELLGCNSDESYHPGHKCSFTCFNTSPIVDSVSFCDKPVVYSVCDSDEKCSIKEILMSKKSSESSQSSDLASGNSKQYYDEQNQNSGTSVGEVSSDYSDEKIIPLPKHCVTYTILENVNSSCVHTSSENILQDKSSLNGIGIISASNGIDRLDLNPRKFEEINVEFVEKNAMSLPKKTSLSSPSFSSENNPKPDVNSGNSKKDVMYCMDDLKKNVEKPSRSLSLEYVKQTSSSLLGGLTDEKKVSQFPADMSLPLSIYTEFGMRSIRTCSREKLMCRSREMDDLLDTTMERQDSYSPDRAGDSGYPNSGSWQDMDMDLTPEQVKEIMTESESSLDSPESPVAPVYPGPPVVHLGENVENGDVANNNRDGEGNNMVGPPVDVGEPLEFHAVIDQPEEGQLMDQNPEGCPMKEVVNTNSTLKSIEKEGNQLIKQSVSLSTVNQSSCDMKTNSKSIPQAISCPGPSLSKLCKEEIEISNILYVDPQEFDPESCRKRTEPSDTSLVTQTDTNSAIGLGNVPSSSFEKHLDLDSTRKRSLYDSGYDSTIVNSEECLETEEFFSCSELSKLNLESDNSFGAQCLDASKCIVTDLKEIQLGLTSLLNAVSSAPCDSYMSILDSSTVSLQPSSTLRTVPVSTMGSQFNHFNTVPGSPVSSQNDVMHLAEFDRALDLLIQDAVQDISYPGVEPFADWLQQIQLENMEAQENAQVHIVALNVERIGSDIDYGVQADVKGGGDSVTGP